MYTCRAHVTLDVNHTQRAVYDLREELTLKVRAADPFDVPDWTTLSVAGPTESWGPQGQIHFGYQGTVRVRSRGERAVSQS
jgi:hypothetical protein